MRRRSAVMPWLCLLALPVATGLPASAVAEDENATSIGIKLDEQFAKACNAGDQKTLIGLYADDAVAILPGETDIGRNQTAIQAMLKRLCDPDLGNSVRLVQVEGMRIDPNHILLVGEWAVVSPGPDGSPTESRVLASEILVKTKAGWRYLLDHASSAPPLR